MISCPSIIFFLGQNVLFHHLLESTDSSQKTHLCILLEKQFLHQHKQSAPVSVVIVSHVMALWLAEPPRRLSYFLLKSIM